MASTNKPFKSSLQLRLEEQFQRTQTPDVKVHVDVQESTTPIGSSKSSSSSSSSRSSEHSLAAKKKRITEDVVDNAIKNTNEDYRHSRKHSGGGRTDRAVAKMDKPMAAAPTIRRKSSEGSSSSSSSHGGSNSNGHASSQPKEKGGFHSTLAQKYGVMESQRQEAATATPTLPPEKSPVEKHRAGLLKRASFGSEKSQQDVRWQQRNETPPAPIPPPPPAPSFTMQRNRNGISSRVDSHNERDHSDLQHGKLSRGYETRRESIRQVNMSNAPRDVMLHARNRDGRDSHLEEQRQQSHMREPLVREVFMHKSSEKNLSLLKREDEREVSSKRTFQAVPTAPSVFDESIAAPKNRSLARRKSEEKREIISERRKSEHDIQHSSMDKEKEKDKQRRVDAYYDNLKAREPPASKTEATPFVSSLASRWQTMTTSPPLPPPLPSVAVLASAPASNSWQTKNKDNKTSVSSTIEAAATKAAIDGAGGAGGAERGAFRGASTLSSALSQKLNPTGVIAAAATSTTTTSSSSFSSLQSSLKSRMATMKLKDNVYKYSIQQLLSMNAGDITPPKGLIPPQETNSHFKNLNQSKHGMPQTAAFMGAASMSASETLAEIFLSRKEAQAHVAELRKRLMQHQQHPTRLAKRPPVFSGTGIGTRKNPPLRAPGRRQAGSESGSVGVFGSLKSEPSSLVLSSNRLGERFHRSGGHGGLGGGLRREKNSLDAFNNRHSQSYHPQDRSRRSRLEPELLVYDGPVEPLVPSENRWRAQNDVKKGTLQQEAESSLNLVIKTVQSVLNKLTRERFEKLTKQLCQVPLCDLEHLRTFLTLIVDKAFRETSFADVYADVCERLHQRSPPVWPFLRVVKDTSNQSFFWTAVKNDVKNASLSGPFPSLQAIQDAIAKAATASASASTPLPLLDSNKVSFPREEAGIYRIMDYLVYTFTNALLPGQLYCHCKLVTGLSDDEPLVGTFETEQEAMEAAAKQTSIKRLLLTRCQFEFEKQKRTHVKIDDATLTEEERKQKEQMILREEKVVMLGNIRFIGELYKVDMLNKSVVGKCVLKLLGLEYARDENHQKTIVQTENLPDEEDLESACKLMGTIGKKFDVPDEQSFMDTLVLRLLQLSKMNDKFSSRIRFMLKDVLELRDYQWIPRHEEMKQQTLEDIRKEAAKLERMGKNVQHAAISTRRLKGARTSEQIMKEQKDLLHAIPQKKKESWNVSISEVQTPLIPCDAMHAAAAVAVNLFTKEAKEEVEAKEAEAEDKDETKGTTSTLNPLNESLDVQNKYLIRMENILKEYLSLLNVDEMMECLKDVPRAMFVSLVEKMLQMALEGKEGEREEIFALMVELYENEVLDSQEINDGIQKVVEFLEDMKLDIPLVHEYMANLFGKLIACGCFDLAWMHASLEHVVENGLAALVFSEALHALEHEANIDLVMQLLRQVPVDFVASFLPSSKRSPDDVTCFIESTQLKDYLPSVVLVDEAEKEKIQGKIHHTIEEFLIVQDPLEVCRCLEEFPDFASSMFVEMTLVKALEGKPKHIALLSSMLAFLFRKEWLSQDDFQEGIANVILIWEELKIDCPNINPSAAKMLAPLLFQVECISFAWLAQAFRSSHVSSNLAKDVVYQLFKHLEMNVASYPAHAHVFASLKNQGIASTNALLSMFESENDVEDDGKTMELPALWEHWFDDPNGLLKETSNENSLKPSTTPE